MSEITADVTAGETLSPTGEILSSGVQGAATGAGILSGAAAAGLTASGPVGWAVLLGGTLLGALMGGKRKRERLLEKKRGMYNTSQRGGAAQTKVKKTSGTESMKNAVSNSVLMGATTPGGRYGSPITGGGSPAFQSMVRSGSDTFGA